MPLSAAYRCDAGMLALIALCPELSGCDFRQALYLDTETTGLGGTGVVAFLVGLGWFDGAGQWVSQQLLLRQLSEEVPLLECVREHVTRASALVTYNGKAFDWPTLTTRCVMNRLPVLPERPHFDLLHAARRIHRPRLGASRLITLENEVLGFVRGDDIAGSEVPGRYAHFQRTGDQEALRAVVEHNAWDLASMGALVGLYGEPMTVLHRDDLAALARTLRRAGATALAESAAEAAVQRGAGTPALRVRAELAKARGDRARALADFEALSRDVNDPTVRLELAKLYEHFVKQPLVALETALAGTGEPPEAAERRLARLLRKSERRKLG
ncbi:ribonuclease H-like domain-containing protein [Myxococcota bacterium]